MTVWTIPEEPCDHCGAPIKWVQLMPHNTPVPIDADARGNYDPMGKLYRIKPTAQDRRIDCVAFIAEDARHTVTYTYTPHKHTCPQADQWASGHRRAKKKQARYGPRPDPIQEGDPDPQYR